MAEIELSRGYWTRVDWDRVPELMKHSWSVLESGKKLYAKTHIDGRTVYMHRLIIGAPSNKRIVVDHIDSDGLNNVRYNLRLATPQQNAQNSAGAVSRRASATRGVSRRQEYEDWRAYIYVEGRFRHLGYFDTEPEATAARLKAEAEFFGEFAFQCRPAALSHQAMNDLACHVEGSDENFALLLE